MAGSYPVQRVGRYRATPVNLKNSICSGNEKFFNYELLERDRATDLKLRQHKKTYKSQQSLFSFGRQQQKTKSRTIKTEFKSQMRTKKSTLKQKRGT